MRKRLFCKDEQIREVEKYASLKVYSDQKSLLLVTFRGDGLIHG